MLHLPPELIIRILSYVSPGDLTSLARTCGLLRIHATSDVCWKQHVQDNVPGVLITSPSPCKTYHDLYLAHDPHWYLPKYKIWFNDYFLTGKIIIARYDPRRGCIEAYRLVAGRGPQSMHSWALNETVTIFEFVPIVHLHLDQPVIHLEAPSLADMDAVISRHRNERYEDQTFMQISDSSAVRANFMLARVEDAGPDINVWPPTTIPARQRVRNEGIVEVSGRGTGPQRRSEICEGAFRLRLFMHLPLNLGRELRAVVRPMREEQFQTFATLDPVLYTPTPDKPFRGIWVGDYRGHGCEFILMHQPETEPYEDDNVHRLEDETQEDYQNRRREARMYRGRIEAVKLTGDPNVPRGEYTFIADDIGPAGFVRVADEGEFEGARVVRSRGQVAEDGFINSKLRKSSFVLPVTNNLRKIGQFIDTQLFLISPDKMAQYWIEFRNINFFERVRIDDLLRPSSL